MVQPAGELLNEIMDMSGEKRFILGRDERGRVDMFIYCEKKDRVYHIKVEEIRPRLKGPFYGHDVTGFGDEIYPSDELIEGILRHGLGMGSGEEMMEKLCKFKGVVGLPVGSMSVEGPTEVFYAARHSDSAVIRQLRQRLSRKIDGKLSAELDAYLLKKKLGSGDYIW